MHHEHYHLEFHRTTHRQRLAQAAMHRAGRSHYRPNCALMWVGAALVAAGERVQAQATKRARGVSTGRVANLTNELHRL